jgi:hypothetical protein
MYSSSFLNSALDVGEWSVSGPSRALPPGKGPIVPIGHCGAGGPQSRFRQRGYRKNPLASARDGTSFARSSSPLPDTILTETPRLL